MSTSITISVLSLVLSAGSIIFDYVIWRAKRPVSDR